MKDNHKIVNLDKNLPLRIMNNTRKIFSAHWHDLIEIMWVLDGECDVELNGANFKMRVEDLILINPSDVRSSSLDVCTMLVFQFDPTAIGISPIDQAQFNCNIITTVSQELFIPLKTLLARLMQMYQDNSFQSCLKCKAILFELYSYLLVNFKAKIQLGEPQSLKFNLRIQRSLLRKVLLDINSVDFTTALKRSTGWLIWLCCCAILSKNTT